MKEAVLAPIASASWPWAWLVECESRLPVAFAHQTHTSIRSDIKSRRQGLPHFPIINAPSLPTLRTTFKVPAVTSLNCIAKCRQSTPWLPLPQAALQPIPE